MRQESRREILSFLVVAASAFLWVCLLTHDASDYLGPSGPTQNACGPVGATVGFQLILWLGSLGAYGLTAAVSMIGLCLFFRRRIPELGWKIVGTVLLVLALASLEVALQPAESLPSTLPGGYYGQFFYAFLFGNVSAVGTYLILGLVAVVAFVLSTDTILYPALARAGAFAAERDRWERVAAAIRTHVPAVHLPRLPLPRPRLSWDWKERAETERDRGAGAEGSPRGRRRGAEAASGTAEKPASKERSATGVANAGAMAAGATPGSDVGTSVAESVGGVAPKTPVGGGDDAGGEDVESQDEPRLDARPPLKIREPQMAPSASRKRLPQRTDTGPYKLPPLDLLDHPVTTSSSLDKAILEQTASKIEETLRHFKIEARVVEVQKGPTITQYELTLAAGIKVHKIINLSDDLAIALKAPSIRIVAPIPGKSTVGVEVPNKNRSPVCLREVLSAPEFRNEDYQLPLALGKDVAGAPVIGDLGDMPHLLIAGSTGSGKSICINSIITTLLLTRTPEEVKLILVDPKMVELNQFENIPHLLAPVVTDMKKAPAILGWTVDKMEERYELFAMAGVRHITSYNSLGGEKLRERLREKVDEADIDDFPDRLPWIVVIIDELADLMMTASKEVETSITRLSQKSRAVGIHVILATQRPSVDVITGLIKANMPSRISFHVASKVDSRTILDRNGSEKLLGKGDMLYLPPGTSALRRVQGTYISDKEIKDVVDYSVRQAEPEFSPELTRFGVDGAGEACEEDDLYEEAVRIVLGSRRGSVTLLQRQLQIGYTRASRLMELMHEQGLVGPFKGSKAREVYYTLEDYENAKRRKGSSSDAEGGAGAGTKARSGESESEKDDSPSTKGDSAAPWNDEEE
jgi:S-DNA-T family DNA segregation ATPase FtsK/SpoIIIE